MLKPEKINLKKIPVGQFDLHKLYILASLNLMQWQMYQEILNLQREILEFHKDPFKIYRRSSR